MALATLDDPKKDEFDFLQQAADSLRERIGNIQEVDQQRTQILDEPDEPPVRPSVSAVEESGPTYLELAAASLERRQNEDFLTKLQNLPPEEQIKGAQQFIARSSAYLEASQSDEFKSARTDRAKLAILNKIGKKYGLPRRFSLPREVGVGEQLKRSFTDSKNIPLIGGFTKVKQLWDTRDAAIQVEKGKGTARDWMLLAQHTKENVQDAQERTFLGGAARIGAESAPFWVEFYASGGLPALVKKGAISQARKQVANSISRKILKRIRKFGDTIPGNSLARLPAFSHRVVSDQARRRIPTFATVLPKDPNAEIHFVVFDPGEGQFQAWKNAIADTYIEIVSEQTGEILGAIGGKVKKLFGLKTKKVGARDFLSQFGFHGVVQEMGEERVGELLRHAATQMGAVELPQDFPTAEQIAQEAVAFSGPALGQAGVNRVRRFLNPDTGQFETVPVEPGPPTLQEAFEGAEVPQAPGPTLDEAFAGAPVPEIPVPQTKKDLLSPQGAEFVVQEAPKEAEKIAFNADGTLNETPSRTQLAELNNVLPESLTRTVKAPERAEFARLLHQSLLGPGVAVPAEEEVPTEAEAPPAPPVRPDIAAVQPAPEQEAPPPVPPVSRETPVEEIKTTPRKGLKAAAGLVRQIGERARDIIFPEGVEEEITEETGEGSVGEFVIFNDEKGRGAKFVKAVRKELPLRLRGRVKLGPLGDTAAIPAGMSELVDRLDESGVTQSIIDFDKRKRTGVGGRNEVNAIADFVEANPEMFSPGEHLAVKNYRQIVSGADVSRVQVGELDVGTTLEIDGEKHTVTGTNPDVGSVFLENGITLEVPKEQFVAADEGSVKPPSEQPTGVPTDIFGQPEGFLTGQAELFGQEQPTVQQPAVPQLPERPPETVDDRRIRQQFEDIEATEAFPFGANVPEQPQTRREKAQDEIDDLWGEYRDDFEGKVFTGLDPKLVAFYGRLAKAYVKRGVATLQDFIDRVIEQIGREKAQEQRQAIEAGWKQAKPEEPAKPPPKKRQPPPAFSEEPSFGTRNAITDQRREALGLRPAMKPASEAWSESWDEAMRVLEDRPNIQDVLIHELRQEIRSVRRYENALLTHRQIELETNYQEGIVEMGKAQKAGNTEKEIFHGQQNELLINELLVLYDIMKGVGTEAGRELNIRKMLVDDQFNPVRMIQMKKAAMGVTQISAEDRKAVEEAHKRIKELEAQLAAVNAKVDELKAEQASQERMQELGVTDARKKKTAKKKAEIRKKIETGWSDFEKKFGAKIFANPLDPELIGALTKIAKNYLDLAVVTVQSSFQDFFNAVVKDIGKAKADSAKKSLQKAWELAVSKADIPTPKKQLKIEESGALSRFANQLAKFFVEEGVEDRDQLIDAVHAEFQALVPGITRRQTMDAISRYGQFSELSKEELEVRLRDLKGQMQQVAKLEDMQEGRAPLKTGVERRSPSDEERRLIQQVNEMKKKGGFEVVDPATQLKSALGSIKTRLRNQIADLEAQIESREKIVKERRKIELDEEAQELQRRRNVLKEQFDEIFPKKEMSDQKRTEFAIAAVKRSIADLERRIAKKDIKPKKPKKVAKVTPELAALRTRRDALRAELDELRELQKPKKTPEQRALAALKTRTRNRIAEYQERLARRDFAKKVRRTTPLDKEAEELRFKAEQAKAEYMRELAKDERQRRTLPQKIGGFIVDAINASRAIITSIDFSAVLRQGGIIVYSRPLLGARQLGDMFRSFRSRAALSKANNEIQSRPNAKNGLYKRSGLSLTDVEGELTQREEMYMGHWSQHIPLVAGSERAYVTFLNKLRADTFDMFVATLGRDGSVTDAEAKVIANYVNVATGRPGTLKKSAVALATVFFAPKYVISRFQYLFLQPLWLKGGSARVRKMIAAEYGRTFVGLSMLYGTLAAGAFALFGTPGDDEEWDIEFNPLSSDFGKIRIGNTRIDPLAGLQQAAVLMTRISMGATKRLKSGKIVPIRDSFTVAEGKVPPRGQTTADVVFRFVRTKLAPAVGTSLNIVDGKNVIGERTTTVTVARDLLTPMSLRDVHNYMREQGIPIGTSLSLMEIFGHSVQHHDQKEISPGEQAVNDIRDLADEFLEKKGFDRAIMISGGGGFKDLKQSALDDDYPAFQAAIKEWMAPKNIIIRGDKNFEGSLVRLDPTSRIKADFKSEFKDGLSEKNKAKMKLADEHVLELQNKLIDFFVKSVDDGTIDKIFDESE